MYGFNSAVQGQPIIYGKRVLGIAGDINNLNGKAAREDLPLTEQRGDPSKFEDSSPDQDEVDPQDISTILMGAQAITGKAVNSASRMSVGEEARQHAVRDQQKRQDQEAREHAEYRDRGP